jgi:glycosyltransferase involved in cell wall biosynthesis
MVSLGAGEVEMLAALWPESADKLHFLPLPTVTAPMAAIGAARLANPRDLTDGRPVQLLSLGRLAVQKDPQTLLHALALVRGVDWRMTLVGDGPLRREAEGLANDLNILERVKFAGFIADPAPYLAAADHLILSSRWEGLCAVAMEALACGCGVVTTECSPSLTALLAPTGCPVPVPVGDAEALARSIEQAVARPAPLSQLLAAAAPYAMDAATDAHIALFDKLMP